MTITCTVIGTAEAFGSCVLTPGVVTITCTGIGSAESFGSCVVSPGVVVITCTGIATGESFGGHVLMLSEGYFKPGGRLQSRQHGSGLSVRQNSGSLNSGHHEGELDL